MFYFFHFVIDFLPEFLFPITEITNAINSFAGMVSNITWIFPVATFLKCLGVFILIEGAGFSMSLFNWLIRKIPTID